MKKVVTTIALFAVLGTLAVSCQKENELDYSITIAEGNNVYNVCYTVDGVTYRVSFIGDEAWKAFVKRMIALAEEGHKVSFRNENASSQTAFTKEVLTYTTSSHDDAYEWAEKKAKEGYDVTIDYDERTGKFTCIAIR